MWKNYDPWSVIGMKGVILSETMFWWVLWVKERPHEHQDPGFLVEHCNVAMISVCFIHQWVYWWYLPVLSVLFWYMEEKQENWHY